MTKEAYEQMMDQNADLLTQAIKFVSTKANKSTNWKATVREVNKSKNVVDIEDGEGNRKTASLVVNTVSKDHQMVAYPKVGSQVICNCLYNNIGDSFVISIEQIEEVVIRFTDISLVMNQDGVVFNGGDLLGMVKVKDLVTQLNTIEQDLNILKGLFAGWTPAPMDGGAVLKGLTATWAGQQITPTIIKDLENEKVKH